MFSVILKRNLANSFVYTTLFLLITCAFIEVVDFFCNRHGLGEYADDDIGLTIDELVTKHGYHLEKHTITTEDGYILEMHRMYQLGRNGERNKVVFLMHGFMQSSISWLTGGPRHSLAYHFADQNYDVWLGNFRGNSFSRHHKYLDPDVDKRKFFNYSWHEFGIYDVPTQIDYVLSHTKSRKLVYVGHSQGFVALLVTLSERPRYNTKIQLFIGLAPAVFLTHAFSPFIRTFGFSHTFFEWVVEVLDINEVPIMYAPRSSLLTEFGQRYCRDGQRLGQYFCYFSYSLAGGFHNEQMNWTLLPLIYSHAFNGASFKQVLHYVQVKNSGVFRQYDYGKHKNLIHYGRESPPKYKFENVKVPIAVYYSANDWVSSTKDVQNLLTKLPNVILASMPYPNFTHFDFLMGRNVTNFYVLITNLTAQFP